MARTFHVYILSNRRRTVLYTGITNNLPVRLEMHLAGMGSVFVSRYKVFDLVYFEAFERSEEAIAREKQIKGWRREKKLTLILRANPKMIDLKSQLI
ncbi:MAG: GIY-YIG nuclease family protein [Rhodothermales bacterium]|nr:GIY-YIG nuclease family protein [Rhodothermales bacterium]